MSKNPQYHPPESDIEKVLKQTGSDPRKLAIAYLRAQRRAKEANAIAGVHRDIGDMIIGAVEGDEKAIRKAADRGRRRIKGLEE